MKKQPSKGLTFLLSLCTGVGHLYLGAMNRGIQFLILFFGSISMANHFNLDIFGFLIPVVWFYGLFDAMQLASKEVIEDKPLVRWDRLKGPWLGYGLIGLGLLLLADEFLPAVARRYFSWLVTDWPSIRALMLAVVLVGVGVYLLWGRKVKENE